MLIHMLSQRLPPDSVTGAPLQTLQLADALQRSGDTVRIYTTKWPLPPERESRDVEYLPYCTARGLRSISRSLSTVRAAPTISRAQVVHGHALSPMVLAYALARGRRSPPFLVKPSLGGDHSEGELKKLRGIFPAPLLRRVLDRISAFAVLDDTIDEELVALGVPRSRIYRVDNGVDLTRYASTDSSKRARLRREFGFDPQAEVLFFAGQLSPRKGVRELLEAWSAIRREHPRAVLAFAGRGPMQDEVRACGQRNGSIRWLGELPSIAEVLRCVDVLVLPSRAESFGNVIVEAMATGVPVASTRVGVAPDVLVPSENGWFIEDVSAAAIESALRTVFRDRARWQSYGQRGRLAAGRYGFATVAGAYQHIYRGLIASGA